jgi:SAM-dependent methyltransferase
VPRKSTHQPATPAATRESWRQAYEETHYRELPWFSPRPYPWVVAGVEAGWWRRGARILDLGCGAGTNSLYLARSGFRAYGVDLADAAIAAARERAAKARIRADFRVGDVLRLPFPPGFFGGAIDIGCFHTQPVRLRRAYAREVARVLKPRSTFALSWVAREYRGTVGPPHRPSVEEVSEALEPEFLFRQIEFRASAAGRVLKNAPSVYCACLGRRSFPRPPAR